MTMKCTTANGRFGVMAAVTPQKRQCKFESLYPAGSVVEAATTPSRWDVVRSAFFRECCFCRFYFIVGLYLFFK